WTSPRTSPTPCVPCSTYRCRAPTRRSFSAPKRTAPEQKQPPMPFGIGKGAKKRSLAAAPRGASRAAPEQKNLRCPLGIGKGDRPPRLVARALRRLRKNNGGKIRAARFGSRGVMYPSRLAIKNNRYTG